MSERPRVRTIVYAVAAAAFAAGSTGLLPADRNDRAALPCASKGSAENPASRIFELSLKGGKLAAASNTIKARRGEEVELRWSSDRSITLHLHGYDIET